jgi:serum/glucocorticoid-regulated kinase 2
MLTGLPPFYSENTQEMYKKILHQPLTFPEQVGSKARSLLTKLLERDPAKRLGYNGAEEIRNHPFFEDINWQKLLAKEYQMPFKPQIVSYSELLHIGGFKMIFTYDIVFRQRYQ